MIRQKTRRALKDGLKVPFVWKQVKTDQRSWNKQSDKEVLLNWIIFIYYYDFLSYFQP